MSSHAPVSSTAFLLFIGLLPLSAQEKKEEWTPLMDKNRPVATSAALTPAETVAQMQLPEGFSLQLIAGEPDVVQPVAYTIDDRGRLWVVENTNYPNCPGEPKDKILVFEDTDGSGDFDRRTVFLDNATFTTGIAVGFGGVWLGSPPNLLFVPLADGDTPKPAGDPKILLDGWGNEDTHETLNDFIWGPDGWLYGTQGIFTYSHVGKPGTPDDQRVTVNAAVWRYHPQKERFERWCEGASNQWGVDWNDHGEAFFEACVIPHMWHGIEGAHYTRQAGRHENPHLYEDIQTIAWGGYGKAAYCGAMVYLGGAFPNEWHDQFFFHDIHFNILRCETMVPTGSGYQSQRKIDFMVSPDKWFRGLSPQYGPDGGVFVNDWYDRVPCHQQKEYTDRTNGRLYKIVTDKVKPVKVDLSKSTSAELVNYHLHENDWFVRHARRLLQERGATSSTTAALEKILFDNPKDTRQLRALWTLHSQGALTEASALRALSAMSEHVRGWTITVISEDGAPSSALLGKMLEMAKSDPSPVVRRRIASALQRLEPAARWPYLEALAQKAEDKDDQNLPLMLWYAAEASVAADPQRGAALLQNARLPAVQGFIARRITSLVREESTGASAALESLLPHLLSASTEVRGAILMGMNEALRGATKLPEPKGWEPVYAALAKDQNNVVREHARRLAILFGSQAVLTELRELLADANASTDTRQTALDTLVNQRDHPTLETLLGLTDSPSTLRAAAIRSLASYNDPRTAPKLLSLFGTLSTAEKHDTLTTLTARAETTQQLLDAIDADTLPKSVITAPLARVIQGHKRPQFNTWLEANWGVLRTTPEEKTKEIDRYKRFLSDRAILSADVNHGRELFQSLCSNCHTLFGNGGKIGPELPGSFADLDYLLQNLIDPNAAIGKDYQMVFITTKTDELHAGIISAEDASSVTLKTLAEPVTIAIDQIKSRDVSPNSMMPEGLLSALQEPDVRDLFLYLRQSKDTP